MTKPICSIEDCGRPHYGKGYCNLHYSRVWKTGSPVLAPRGPKHCKIASCKTLLKPGSGRGMCGKHYQRWKTHGDPLYQRPLIVGVAECSIEGCSKVIQARGWCAAHWSRWDRHGDPEFRFPWEVVDGKRICPKCKTDTPVNNWSSGCCRSCGKARTSTWRAANPAPLKRHRECLCANCGEWFMGNNKQRRYCSHACRTNDRKRYMRERSAIRRARRYAVEYEPIDHAQVFQRDGWLCGICGLAIDRSLNWPEPLSVSLDHEIPISRGGSHTYPNVQAAHLVCNVKKRDRIDT